MGIIHESGAGADKLLITSQFNGLTYNVCFGEAGSPMRNLFFQGQDASQLIAEYEALDRAADLETPSRDIWLKVLDTYL